MESLRKIAKDATKNIDDVFDRKQAETEIYTSLMDAYDQEMYQQNDSNKALQTVIDHFGFDHQMSNDLKEAHLRKLGPKQITILSFTTLIFFILLYLLVYWLFS
ncbi:MAG: hypothetical protein RR565_06085 [Erysipelothrix sp.]